MSGGRQTVAATVNGDPTVLPRGTSVAALVRARAWDGRGIAVAVDREVIPRSDWERVELTDGAAVEVVTAAAGG